MRWLIPALCFFGGAMFGMLIMALMVANSRAERNEEVMTDAGGSGKQDCEPGDQHDEAVDADDRPCGDDVPPAQEAGKGSEKE